MIDLPNDIESLKEIIKRLLEENAQLQAENAKLRRRLVMDSTNCRQAATVPRTRT